MQLVIEVKNWHKTNKVIVLVIMGEMNLNFSDRFAPEISDVSPAIHFQGHSEVWCQTLTLIVKSWSLAMSLMHTEFFWDDGVQVDAAAQCLSGPP